MVNAMQCNVLRSVRSGSLRNLNMFSDNLRIWEYPLVLISSVKCFKVGSSQKLIPHVGFI